MLRCPKTHTMPPPVFLSLFRSKHDAGRPAPNREAVDGRQITLPWAVGRAERVPPFVPPRTGAARLRRGCANPHAGGTPPHSLEPGGLPVRGPCTGPLLPVSLPHRVGGRFPFPATVAASRKPEMAEASTRT